MAKRREKSDNDLLRQASKLMGWAGVGNRRGVIGQPVNFGGKHIYADRDYATSDRNYERMKKIADIYNRYRDNIAKVNPDIYLPYTGRESGKRIEEARTRKIAREDYMGREAMNLSQASKSNSLT